jgi:hypothetical protein
MKKPSSQIWAVSFIGARGNDKITDLLLVNTKQLYIDFILIRWRVEIATLVSLLTECIPD